MTSVCNTCAMHGQLDVHGIMNEILYAVLSTIASHKLSQLVAGDSQLESGVNC